jgi:hypothetical protein
MKYKIYEVKQNPVTKEILVNEEQFCTFCFENFADYEAIQLHRKRYGSYKVVCKSPKQIGLIQYINTSGAPVWTDYVG